MTSPSYAGLGSMATFDGALKSISLLSDARVQAAPYLAPFSITPLWLRTMLMTTLLFTWTTRIL